LKRFGASAFGPVEVRALSADGVSGDWIPLGTLVRVPGFKELRCPRSQTKPCTLTGSSLFLANSIGTAPDMDNATDVPPDFTGTQLSVSHPTNGTLYLKLRDDPNTVQTLTLPVMPASQSPVQTPAVKTPAAPAAPTQPTEPAAAPAPATTAPPASPNPAPEKTDPNSVPNPDAPTGE
jgi:hypothetical protein